MNPFEVYAYDLRNRHSVKQVTDRIKRTVRIGNKNDLSGLSIIRNMKPGKTTTLSSLTKNNDIEYAVSHNARVVTVVEGCTLVARSPGFAGIEGRDKDGNKYEYVIKVGEGKTSWNSYPLILNKQNHIDRRIKPNNLATIRDSRFGRLQLAAEAACAMSDLKKNALAEGIAIIPVRAYESAAQTTRNMIKKHKSGYYRTATETNIDLGNEYMLGRVADVVIRRAKRRDGEVENNEFDIDRTIIREKGIAWLQENAPLFGYAITRTGAGRCQLRYFRNINNAFNANAYGSIKDYVYAVAKGEVDEGLSLQQSENSPCIAYLSSYYRGRMLETLLDMIIYGNRKDPDEDGKLLVQTLDTIETSKRKRFEFYKMKGRTFDSLQREFVLVQPMVLVIAGIPEKSRFSHNKETFGKSVDSLIAKAKAQDARVFVNIDDEYTRKYKRGSGVITMSCDNPLADYYLKIIERREIVSAEMYVQGKLREQIRFDSINLNSIEDILASYAVADRITRNKIDYLDMPVNNTYSFVQEEERINRLQASLKAHPERKALRITWEDTLEDSVGYHLRCYRDGRFLGGMHVYDAQEYTFGKLLSGKTYYFTVRGYATKHGKRVYSKICNIEGTTLGETEE